MFCPDIQNSCKARGALFSTGGEQVLPLWPGRPGRQGWELGVEGLGNQYHLGLWEGSPHRSLSSGPCLRSIPLAAGGGGSESGGEMGQGAFVRVERKGGRA